MKKVAIFLIMLLSVFAFISCKAKMPEYVAPAQINATYGQTLADIQLPENFSWQDDLSTPVGNVGEHIFKIADIRSDVKILTQANVDSQKFIAENLQNNFSNYEQFKMLVKELEHID